MTKQKKPKVGDTVGWCVVDADMLFEETAGSRKEARTIAKSLAKGHQTFAPYRVARIVLDK